MITVIEVRASGVSYFIGNSVIGQNRPTHTPFLLQVVARESSPEAHTAETEYKSKVTSE